MNAVSSEKSIRAIVRTAIETYTTTFSERHLSEIYNPNVTINIQV